MSFKHFYRVSHVALLSLLIALPAVAQKAETAPANPQDVDPLKREISPEQKKRKKLFGPEQAGGAAG